MNTITHPPPGGVQFISTPDAERQLLLNATPARKLAQHLYDAHLSASRVVAAAHRGRIDPAICRKKTLVDLTACPPRVSLRDYVCERIHDLTGLNYPVEIPPQHRSICDDVAADVEELLENDQPIGLLPLLLAHGENKHLNAAHRYRDAKREAERLSGVLGDVAHQALAGGWDGWAGRACEIGDTLRRCRADLFFSKGTAFRPLASCKRSYCPCCELARRRRMHHSYSTFISNLQQQRHPGQQVAAVLSLGPTVSTAAVRTTVQQGRARFEELRRRSGWTKNVDGYVLALHVVREADHKWHAHFHLVMWMLPGGDAAAALAGWDAVHRLEGIKQGSDGSNGLLAVLSYGLADDEWEGTGEIDADADADELDTPHFIDEIADAQAARALLYATELRNLQRFTSGGCLAGCLKNVPVQPAPLDADDADDADADEESTQPQTDQRLFFVLLRWGVDDYRSIPAQLEPSALSLARRLLRDIEVDRAALETLLLLRGHASEAASGITVQGIGNNPAPLEWLSSLSNTDLASICVTFEQKKLALRLLQISELVRKNSTSKRQNSLEKFRTYLYGQIIGWTDKLGAARAAAAQERQALERASRAHQEELQHAFAWSTALGCDPSQIVVPQFEVPQFECDVAVDAHMLGTYSSTERLLLGAVVMHSGFLPAILYTLRTKLVDEVDDENEEFRLFFDADGRMLRDGFARMTLLTACRYWLAGMPFTPHVFALEPSYQTLGLLPSQVEAELEAAARRWNDEEWHSPFDTVELIRLVLDDICGTRLFDEVFEG